MPSPDTSVPLDDAPARLIAAVAHLVRRLKYGPCFVPFNVGVTRSRPLALKHLIGSGTVEIRPVENGDWVRLLPTESRQGH